MSTSDYSNNDVSLLAGRLLMAVIFVVSGVEKLVSPGPTIGYIASLGLPAPLLG